MPDSESDCVGRDSCWWTLIGIDEHASEASEGMKFSKEVKIHTELLD